MNSKESPYSLIKLHELSEKELIDRVRARTASSDPADNGPYLSYMEYAMEILNSKWTLDVLFVIAHKKIHRYSQIQKHIPGISGLMLSRTLKKLEHHRIVRRIQYNERPVPGAEQYFRRISDGGEAAFFRRYHKNRYRRADRKSLPIRKSERKR